MKKLKIDMEAHIQKFHTLGGNTFSEHQKNFNVYTKSLEQDPSFNPTEFFKNLRPKNDQEEIFRVRLLQKFNQHSELIDVLKSGNRILARVALKDKNFLRELLRKYSLENKFTEELTPYVSYVTRVNLINKLAVLVDDEKVAEEFYKKVYERYGLQFASEFLVKCRPDFIRYILQEFEVELEEDDLILLHKHSPEVFEEYLKKHARASFGLKLSTYLARASLEEFHRLTKYARFVLGKKFRKRYINAHKADLIEDPNNFPLSLDKKVIAKHLNIDEMIKLLENHIHKRRSYRYYSEIAYLENYPRTLRGHILFTAYKNVNGCELWENPRSVDEDLLKILSVEDRLKFDFINKFPELLPLSQAIPAIKTKINVTSDIYERGSLCVKLLEACTYNESCDEELLEILKYFYGRHKNDHGHSHVNFLSFLVKNFPKLENLGKDYWEIIEELILLLEVNNEHLYCKPELLGKFLNYQFLNGIECRKTLVMFFKAVSSHCSDFSELLGKCEKNCILRYPELFLEIHTEENDLKWAKLNYLDIILNYNKRHPKIDQINPYDYFEYWSNAMEKYIENKYYCTNLIISLIECKPQNEVEQKKLNEFWGKIKQISAESGFTPEFYKWLLRNEPLVILENPKKFFESISLNENSLVYDVNKFNFLGITEKLDACGFEILSSESENKIPAIVYFSNQSKSVDLLINLCLKYSPGEACKINVKAEDIKKIVDIQSSLIRSFKNTPLPSKLIETLLPFCNGDYFKYSLEPLYFVMYHTTEDKIEKPIFELLKRAVSVRKHTVHLTGALGSIDLKLKVFSMMAKEEKNVSVKKYIFGKIYNLFIKEETLTSWELLRDNIKLITIDDSESLQKLKSVSNVPKKFLNSYLIAIWDFFSSFQNKSEFELIPHFKRNLTDPSLEGFCRKVVMSSLYNPKNEYVNDTEVFTANYLLMGIENMDERMEFVWDLIQTRSKNEREKHRILTSFCSVIKNKNPTTMHKNLISKILMKSPSLNLKNNLLSLELLLNSTNFYVNWNKSHTTLVNFIVEQHAYLIERYSPQILHYFKDFLLEFLRECFDYDRRNSDVLKVIKRLLVDHDSEKFGLLGFLMLPSDFEDCKELMKNVLSILKVSTSTVLKVYLDQYLNEHSEFDDVE